MENFDLLENSCKRLPRLLELKAPVCIVVAEVRLLMDLAMEAVQDTLHTDFHSELTKRRRDKATQTREASEAAETAKKET